MERGYILQSSLRRLQRIWGAKCWPASTQSLERPCSTTLKDPLPNGYTSYWRTRRQWGKTWLYKGQISTDNLLSLMKLLTTWTRDQKWIGHAPHCDSMHQSHQFYHCKNFSQNVYKSPCLSCKNTYGCSSLPQSFASPSWHFEPPAQVCLFSQNHKTDKIKREHRGSSGPISLVK